MIFPGGCLPSVTALIAVGHRARATCAWSTSRTSAATTPTPWRWRDNLDAGWDRRGRRRLRPAVPAPVGPLPGLLRGGLPGAPHQRRPGGPGRPPPGGRRPGGLRGRSDDRPARPRPRRRPAAGAPPRMARGSWRLGVPFVLLHLCCLLRVVVGWSPVAVAGGRGHLRGPGLRDHRLLPPVLRPPGLPGRRPVQFAGARSSGPRPPSGARCGGRPTTGATTAPPTARATPTRRWSTTCPTATSCGSSPRPTRPPTRRWWPTWPPFPSCASSTASTTWCPGHPGRPRSPWVAPAAHVVAGPAHLGPPDGGVGLRPARPSSCSRPPSPSTRWPTGWAAAASRPPTPAATTGGWPWYPGRGLAQQPPPLPGAPARASPAGSSTSPGGAAGAGPAGAGPRPAAGAGPLLAAARGRPGRRASGSAPPARWPGGTSSRASVPEQRSAPRAAGPPDRPRPPTTQAPSTSARTAATARATAASMPRQGGADGHRHQPVGVRGRPRRRRRPGCRPRGRPRMKPASAQEVAGHGGRQAVAVAAHRPHHHRAPVPAPRPRRSGPAGRAGAVATAVARCSSPTVSSPRAQRSPMCAGRATSISVWTSTGPAHDPRASRTRA